MASGMRAVVLTTERKASHCSPVRGWAGSAGALLMQSSGVGNCIKQLANDRECRFPLLTLVTMAAVGRIQSWQVPWAWHAGGAREAGVMVKRSRMRHAWPKRSTPQRASLTARHARRRAIGQRVIGTRNGADDDAAQSRYELERRAVVAAILAQRGDTLVVTGLGSPTWDSRGGDDPATSISGEAWAAPRWSAWGSLSRPERRIHVITGDGEMLMGLGSLATIARSVPRISRSSCSTTSAMARLACRRAHLPGSISGVAKASLFTEAGTVKSAEDLQAWIPKLYPLLPDPVRGRQGLDRHAAAHAPLRDGTHIKNRFRGSAAGQKAFE